MRFASLNKGFFILILLVVSWAFFDVLKPYYSAILWGIVLAIIFYPVKQKILDRLPVGNTVASLLTLTLICLLVFIPLAVMMSSLVVEANTIYTRLQENGTQFPEVVARIFRQMPSWAQQFFAEHHLDNAETIQQHLSQVALKSGQYLANSAFMIGKGTFGFVVSFGIMLYLLFFLLKDGRDLVQLVLQPMPLAQSIKQHLLGKFAAVSRATVKGTVVVGVVQGILGGLAFLIVGIEGCVLWGALIAILSLVPAIGSALIWVPAAVFMFATDQIWQGIFIVAFFIVVIGLVDNLLRPLLVGKDTRMPDYLILISTLGGMEVYGINGFVIGPLIAALFIASWNQLSTQSDKSSEPCQSSQKDDDVNALSQ